VSVLQSSKELALARKYIEQTNTNIFLTGKAGTGKTTFLRNLKETSFKRMIVVAPTGVAAINAGGVTIHSFFQLDFAPFVNGSYDKKKYYRFSNIKKNIIRSLDLVVIDEISMVRSDVLDAIDHTLKYIRRDRRKEPFGGIQMLLIGDLGQLPPVCSESDWDMLSPHYDTPYFFSSIAWQQAQFVTITLTNVFRQSDKNFISILNHIRDNTLNTKIIEQLNDRSAVDYDPDFDRGYIILCTHNYQAQKINDNRLAQIEDDPYTYEATIDGDFPQSSYPNDEALVLKRGAQVMFLKNDVGEMKNRKYYNGKIGTITELNDKKIIVHCKGDDYDIEVKKYTWENTTYTLNKETSLIEEKVQGTFQQYPLRLAWAITIHKSQGLTFDKVIIDSNQAFATGQVYVALSRCRTLEGIILTQCFNPDSIILDQQITSFTDSQVENAPTEQRLKEDSAIYLRQTLLNLYSFAQLHNIIEQIEQTNNRSFCIADYDKSRALSLLTRSFDVDIYEVSLRFASQITGLCSKAQSIDMDLLFERQQKAIAYFKDKLKVIDSIIDMLRYFYDGVHQESDFIEQSLISLDYERVLKESLFDLVSKDMDLKDFLVKRNTILAIDEKKLLKEKGKKQPQNSQSAKSPLTTQMAQELREQLRQWRQIQAQAQDKKAFQIMTNKALDALCVALPKSDEELLQVYGIGQAKCSEYGGEILQIINEYLQSNVIES